VLVSNATRRQTTGQSTHVLLLLETGGDLNVGVGALVQGVQQAEEARQ
jgi:hypothetical protein